MPALTIRDLTPDAEDALRRQAAARGRSVQQEARAILETALPKKRPSENQSLYAYVRSLVEPIGGVDDLEIPPRDIARDLPTFD